MDYKIFLDNGPLGLCFLLVIVLVTMVNRMITNYRSDIKELVSKGDARADRLEKLTERSIQVVEKNSLVMEMCQKHDV